MIDKNTWTTQDSIETYNILNWGKGYFGVSPKGNVTVHPSKSTPCIDLLDLVESLQRRNIDLPILLRFTDILKHRLGELYAAFHTAIAENEYKGSYCCVYPIKVNQQRHVVEEILDFGRNHTFGIEAGSKPELLAVLALAESKDTPIICNGFKDDEFIETVCLATKMGKTIIPVVEKFSELEMIIKYATQLNVRPRIGIRVKLATRGAGRWESSAGMRSKFGLTVSEVLRAVDLLKQHDLADCLQLMHFHMGSQITNIRNIKNAINEAARLYVELKRAGAGMRYLDVGGGLGIDYDGSQTNYGSSVNYTLQEYASNVIFRIKSVCDECDIEHPIVITESGRAIVAYHSVLIFNVLGTHSFDSTLPSTQPPDDAPKPLWDLYETYRTITKKNLLESYHDAVQARDEAFNLFSLGYLSLDQRAVVEKAYWAICERVSKLAAELEYVPDEIANLAASLSDTYFCNFSIFQSMPDSWAIGQLFPIMPIHRLTEEPTRRAVLADITCDSDGKVDKFIDLREVKRTLELHPYIGQRYYIGAFLVGAYQEILGDLHNLLGDTNAVHVSLDDDGEVCIDHLVKGDTVREVLSYVQYSGDELLGLMRKSVEKAVREKHITPEESGLLMNFYESALEGYTYLEEPAATVSISGAMASVPAK